MDAQQSQPNTVVHNLLDDFDVYQPTLEEINVQRDLFKRAADEKASLELVKELTQSNKSKASKKKPVVKKAKAVKRKTAKQEDD